MTAKDSSDETINVGDIATEERKIVDKKIPANMVRQLSLLMIDIFHCRERDAQHICFSAILDTFPQTRHFVFAIAHANYFELMF